MPNEQSWIFPYITPPLTVTFDASFFWSAIPNTKQAGHREIHRMHRQLRSRREAILRNEALAGGGRDVAGRRAFNAALHAHRLRGGGEKRKREEEEEEEKETPVCGICLEPPSNAIVTPCGDKGHRFCKDCLSKWFDTQCCSCPLCRADLNYSVEALDKAAKEGYKAFVEMMLARFEDEELIDAAADGMEERVRTLLDAGADPNQARTSDGATPLYAAAQNGHAGVVEVLLARGADPNKALTTDGATPCWVAAWNGHAGVVELLLAAGADPNKARTSDGATPCIAAAHQGHAGVVELLLADRRTDPNKEMTNTGATPLYVAAEEGHAGVMEVLLSRGADPNKATTDTGATPCYVAAQEGHAGVVAALLNDRRTDPNKATTDDGSTPCWIAAWKGHAGVVEVLLARGADPNKATTDDGATPCFVAAQRGHAGVVELLLARGADPNKARTDDGVTPLHGAVTTRKTLTLKMLLRDPRIEINKRTVTGRTALYVAVQHAVETMKEMNRIGTSDDDDDIQRRIDLMSILLRNEQSDRIDTISMLLRNGADPDLATDQGDTPCAFAGREGHEAVVQLLREQGATCPRRSARLSRSLRAGGQKRARDEERSGDRAQPAKRARREAAKPLIGMMSGPGEVGDLMRERGRWFDEQASEADASKLVGSFSARSCYGAVASLRERLEPGELLEGATAYHGFVLRPRIPIPIAHAFVVDGEGRVLETQAWRGEPGTLYYGIPLPHAQLKTVGADFVVDWARGAAEEARREVVAALTAAVDETAAAEEEAA